MYCNTKHNTALSHRSHNAHVYCSVYFTEINNSTALSCKTEMQVEARSKQTKPIVMASRYIQQQSAVTVSPASLRAIQDITY
jgi:hypothetical protein